MSDNEEIDYNEFVSKSKSLLIAPAGYGKTHKIAECLNYTEGKQLILTHTHAGVASIKEKIKKEKISSNRFNVETISSYAQKYVLAFHYRNDIPDQENDEEYYPFIIANATRLVRLKPIADVIASTYSALFVDEYQDCTVKQHNFILAIADILPTHILGDYLQGIYGFKGETLVDMNNSVAMGEFLKNKYELETPWRWINSNNENLCECLKDIREKIIKRECIDLEIYTPHIEIKIIDEFDLYNKDTDYRDTIWNLQNETSLLIIHPESTSIYPRKKIVSSFNNSFTLIEAIDDKDFYKITKKLDESTIENIINIIRDTSYNLFNKTAVNNWFNKNNLKSKRKECDRLLIQPIGLNLRNLEKKISFVIISDTLKKINNLPDIKCYRNELFHTICKSLEEAECNNISVYEAMVKIRNQIRRIGRKVHGRCIGTTLLTKGLEFETVAVLNAHKFTDPKNLYVALTRATKRLIVFTKNKTLSPYE